MEQFHPTTSLPFCKSSRGKLQELERMFHALPDTDLVRALRRKRTGPKGYPVRPFIRSFIAMHYLEISSQLALFDEMDDDPELRAICGFDDNLPCQRTVNYQFARLKQFPELIAQCMAVVTSWYATEKDKQDREKLRNNPKATIRPFGSELKIDSTVIRSESVYKKDGSSDPEATLGYAHKRGVFIHKGGVAVPEPAIFKHGYRAQVIADGPTGFPLTMDFYTGSANDNPALIPLADRSLRQHPFIKPGASLAGDMGYAALENRNWLENRGIAAVFNWPKPTTNSGLIDNEYDLDGRPFCTGKQKMEFLHYDPNGDLVYGCPAGGCHLKNSLRGGARHCEDLHPVSKGSPVYCSIPPATPKWKRIRKSTWRLEGLYSKVKGKMPLERHHLRGFKAVQLHTMLCLLTYQLKEYVKIREGRVDELGRMRRKRLPRVNMRKGRYQA